jgi:hypothetical protein
MTASSVLTRITSPSVSAFDLFEDIEQFLVDSRNKHRDGKLVIRALGTRCESEPSFRTEIIDIDIIGTVLDLSGPGVAVDGISEIPKIVGDNVELKTQFGNAGVLTEIRGRMREVLNDQAATEKFIPALISLLSGCDRNKKEFFSDKPLLEGMIDALRSGAVPDIDDPMPGEEATRYYSLLTVISTLFESDDASSLFVRESVISYAGGIAEFSNEILDKYKAVSSEDIISILAQLCNSQSNCGLMIELGWLDFVMGNIHESCKNRERLLVSAKFLRALAFDDKLKPILWPVLRDVYKPVRALIHFSFEDAGVASHLFGIWANLSLRNKPTMPTEIIMYYPSMTTLIEATLYNEGMSMNTKIQCMQYLRCLAKTEPDTDSMKKKTNNLFEEIEPAVMNINNKTVQRIAAEIYPREGGY